MKTILCYGDSLTFGSSPLPNGPRHPYEDRWPTVLEAGLGGKARCIAEGLGGRTTVHDDWFTGADRNGARLLPTLLYSHAPLDLIAIMLGTNDLKPIHGQMVGEAARGMVRLVEIIRGHFGQSGQAAPEIILMAPPPLVETSNADMLNHFGGPAVIAESKGFAAEYARRARELKVHFFDAGSVAQADPGDGVHLDGKNTRAIGAGLVPLVKTVLGI